MHHDLPIMTGRGLRVHTKTACLFKIRRLNDVCGFPPSAQPGKADQEEDDEELEEEEGKGDRAPPPPQQQLQQKSAASSKSKKKKSKKAEKGAAKAGNAGGGGGTAPVPLPPPGKGSEATSSPQDDIDRIVWELNLSTVRERRDVGFPWMYFHFGMYFVWQR